MMHLLETKLILALLLPGLFVLFFTRVTYNQYIGLLIVIALIAASVYAGYTDHLIFIVADSISIVIGFMFSQYVIKDPK